MTLGLPKTPVESEEEEDNLIPTRAELRHLRIQQSSAKERLTYFERLQESVEKLRSDLDGYQSAMEEVDEVMAEVLKLERQRFAAGLEVGCATYQF